MNRTAFIILTFWVCANASASNSVVPVIQLILDDVVESECTLEPNIAPVSESISIEIRALTINQISLDNIFTDENCDELVIEIIDSDGIDFAEIANQALEIAHLTANQEFSLVLKATDPDGESVNAEISITVVPFV